MKINVSSDVNAIPERNVNTIDPKDQEKWELEWDISNLRTEIRKDMQDYKLLWTDRNVGCDDQKLYLFLPQDTLYEVRKNSIYYKFSEYLEQRIIDNLIKLVEQNND